MGPEHRSTIILSIGRDRELLSSRHLLLQSAGYVVQSTPSIESAIKSLHDGDFDLVIVCHTVSSLECSKLAECIRKDRLSLPVVVMAAGCAIYSDRSAIARSESAPTELLHSVETALLTRTVGLR